MKLSKSEVAAALCVAPKADQSRCPSGVLLERKRLVATDGHALVKVDLADPPAEGERTLPEYILPREALTPTAKEYPVDLDACNGALVLRDGRRIAPLDVTFPPYSAALGDLPAPVLAVGVRIESLRAIVEAAYKYGAEFGTMYFRDADTVVELHCAGLTAYMMPANDAAEYKSVD